MEAINFEGCSDRELEAYVIDLRLTITQRAIAQCMVQARRNRAAGDIGNAIGWEDKIEKLYRELPDDLRW